MHVLLVQSSKNLRDALSGALRACGWLVTPVASAAAAIRALLLARRDQLPDLCVTDAEDDALVIQDELVSDERRYGDIRIVTLTLDREPEVDALRSRVRTASPARSTPQ